MELAQYRIETKTRASAILALAGVALVLIFAVLPVFAGRGLIQDLIFVFYMLALAQCWNLLAGYAGLVSVGQPAFVGPVGYQRDFRHRRGKGNVRGAVTGRARHHYLLDRAGAGGRRTVAGLSRVAIALRPCAFRHPRFGSDRRKRGRR